MSIVLLTSWFAACGGGGDTDTAAGDTDTTPIEEDPDSDGDTYPQSQDCDDRNPFVNPGQVEVCDGLDNDCDASTEETGVAFQPAQEAAIDRTADFEGGSATTPYAFTIEEDGALHFCDGTWYTTITVATTGEARVQGHGSAMGDVVLDGGGVATGITITSAAQVNLQGLTLSNFVGGADSFGSAVQCPTEDAVIQGSELEFLNNTATTGGAMAITGGCGIQRLGNAMFKENSAASGGHVAISDAMVDFENVTFEEGTATIGGGALAVGAELTEFDSNVQMRCRNCTFEDNRATNTDTPDTASGGAMWIQSSSTVLLVDSTFKDNAADLAGGAILLQSTNFDDAEAEIRDTEFDGNTAAGVANAISIPEIPMDYDYDGTESVNCDEDDGCVDE